MFPCDSRESSKKVSSLCGPSISIDSMDASSEAPPAWSMCRWVNKIFSGIKFGNEHFDIGSISLEFDLLKSDQDSDILTYSDTQLNDSTRFTEYVKELYASLNIDNHKIS